MKKRYYFTIAISITLAAIFLTGCEQNASEKTSVQPTAAVNNPIATNSDVKSEINYTEKLKSEGYTSKDIEPSESYISRVVLQLNEIQTFGSIYGKPAGIESDSTDNSSKYSELSSKIDEPKAVYYLVKLNRDFNSLEDAFNEYILSLQLDLDMNIYWEDKDKYTKLKNDKVSGTNPDEFITVKDIEEKALENLQNMNKSGNDPGQTVPGINNPNKGLIPDEINPQPDIPVVEVPQPIDPSKDIRDNLGPKY